MKNLILSVLTIAFLSSCNNSKKTDADLDGVDMEKDEIEVVDHHNSQNSLDWAGTYIGMLPCSNCEGIETELRIKEDEYVLKTLRKGLDNSFLEQTGNIIWSDDGSMVILGGMEEGPFMYKVEENRIVQLDGSGNKYTG
ncbi:MAG: copper resistance protein NlpE N-terminal domain-containing protein, partial [Flavobacteriales bacterium]|nr:copper resistance protein NlpE N-terminal domain-containing protein [Flavobacteriales bacterium]